MPGRIRAEGWRTLAALGGLAAVAGLAACGGDEESVTTGTAMGGTQPAEEAPAPSSSALDEPPRIESVTLEPRSPRPGERLHAQVDAVDPEGGKLRLEYEWTLNGRRVEDATGPSLHVEGGAGKGSVVGVNVVAIDPSNQRSAVERATARIGNSPPVVHGLIIEPLHEVTGGTDITATPKASDPDGDELSFEYRWDVNGSTVRNSGATLPGSAFTRGDTVVVHVVASDGAADSDPLRSDPIPVVNAPPRVTSTPGAFDEQGRFVYRVEAEDPDGDTSFRYRLVEAPPGMDLDIVDGTVTWTPREDQAGRHPVKIQVSDTNGASTTQSFVMSLDFEQPEAEASAEETPPAATP